MATTDYKGPESELTGEIIKAAIEVHRNFGCGLKEEEKADTAVLDGAQAHLQNTPRVSEASVTSVVAPQARDSDTEEGL